MAWVFATNFENPPEGDYIGVLVQIIDIGLQESKFKDEVKIDHKLRLAFELPEELMSDGKPYLTFLTVNKKLGAKSTLSKVIGHALKIDPKDVKSEHVSKALGKAIQLSVSDKGWVKGDSLARLLSKTPTPKTINDLIEFNLDDPDPAVFEKLTDYLKGKINEGKQRMQAEAFPRPKPLPKVVHEDKETEY